MNRNIRPGLRREWCDRLSALDGTLACEERAVHSLLFRLQGKAARRKWATERKAVGLGILLADCGGNYTGAAVDVNNQIAPAVGRGLMR